MATLTAYPTSNSSISGTAWAAQTSAYGAPDAAVATWTSSTSGATSVQEYGTYDFSAIPAGVTINSVTVGVTQGCNNTGRLLAPQYQVMLAGATSGSLQTGTLQTALTLNSFATTTFSLAQLQTSNNVRVRVTARHAANSQSGIFNLDAVAITVDYTVPTPAVTQGAYRFYADGTETGSTALAAQDVGALADLASGDVNLALRIRLQSTNATAIPSTDDHQLQWEKNTSGTWADVTDVGLAITYSEANENSFTSTGSTSFPGFAISIQGNNKPLRKLRLKLSRGTPAPSSSLIGRLYADSAGLPGTLLQSGTTVVGSSLSTTLAWVDFDFDGSVTLTSGTTYHIGIGAVAPEVNDYTYALDSTTPTYSGQTAIFNGTNWTAQSFDAIFEVYTSGLGSTVVPYGSASLTDAAATTNRLGAGSGSFTAGKISEDGLVDDLGWTGNNYTEVLYSLTLKQADLAAGDGLRFRVVKNGSTADMTYSQTPTLGVAGAVGFGGVSSGQAANVSTLDLSHTVAIGGAALIVGVGVGDQDLNASAINISSVVLDPAGANTAFTAVSSRIASPHVSAFGHLYGLANVAAGTYTIRVTITGDTADIEAGCVSYFGADTTAPFSAAQSTTGSSVANASLTFTGSTAGSRVHGLQVRGGSIGSVTSGTSRWIRNQNTGSAGGNAAAADIAGTGGSVTLSWTAAAETYLLVAAEIEPVTVAGSSVTLTPAVAASTATAATLTPIVGLSPASTAAVAVAVSTGSASAVTLTPATAGTSAVAVTAGTGPSVRGIGTLLVRTTANTSYPLDMPDTVVNGDILYASITLNNHASFTAGNEFGASDSGVPAGWTKVFNESTNTTTTFSLHVFRKVVTNAGSEPASYTWTAAQAVTGSGNIIAVLNADTTALDGSAVSEYNGDAGTTVTDTITTTVENDLLLCFAGLDGGSTATFPSGPSGFTEQWSYTTTPVGQRNSCGTRALAPATTYTITWTVNTAGTARAFWVAALKPAAAGSSVTLTPATTVATPVAVSAGVSVTLSPAGAAATPVAVAASATPTVTHRLVGVDGTVKTKTVAATSVRLKVGTDTGVTAGVVFSAAQTPDGNGVATHATSGLGLSAGGTYYYRVEMTDSGAGTILDSATPVGRIKVAPTGQTSFAFCFSACHDTADQADSASMAAIATRADDLFFHRGDLFYNDGSSTTTASYRTDIAAALARPNYQKVLATTPFAYSGSDHDSSKANNGNAGSDSTALANFNSIYRELIPTPTLPTGGHYFSFMWGRVLFINLDTRSFATIPSATDNSSKTLLGTTQQQWVKDQITNTTAKLIFLLGDGPWATSASAGDDTWAGYMTARADLDAHIDLVGKPCIYLHGDQHALAADNGTNGLGMPSFAAAPLGQNASQKGTYTTGPYPASGTALVDQYGRVVITDSGSSISAAFTGYSSDNTVRVTLTVNAVTLSPATASAAAVSPVVTRIVTITPASVSSTAVQIVATPSVTITPATAALQAVTPLISRWVALGPATAAASATAVTATPSVTLSPAGVSSSAVSPQVSRWVSLLPAASQAVGVPVTATPTVTLQPSIAVSSALPVTTTPSITLSPALLAAAAQSVTPSLIVTLTPAGLASSAISPLVSTWVGLTAATAVTAAVSVGTGLASAATISPAGLQSAAVQVVATPSVTVTSASSTASAVPVSVTLGALQVTLTSASANSAAPTLTLTPVLALIPATATSQPVPVSTGMQPVQVTISPALASSSAQQIVATPQVTITHAQTITAAVQIAATPTVTISPAATAASAQPLVATPAISLVAAATVTAAVAPSYRATVNLTPAVLTSAAAVVGTGQTSIVTLTRAQVTATALQVVATPNLNLQPATVVSSAQPVVGTTLVTLAAAQVQATGVQAVATPQVTISPAQVTSSAPTITAAIVVALTPAGVTSSARPVAAGILLAVSPAAVTVAAVVITARPTVGLLPAALTARAVAFVFAQGPFRVQVGGDRWGVSVGSNGYTATVGSDAHLVKS